MASSLDDVALSGLADEVDVPWLEGSLDGLPTTTLCSDAGVPLPCPLLHRVLVALREERIRHCVLRDPEKLVSVSGCSRIDLLVHPEDVRRLAGVLELIGFVPLPSRGRSRFFLAYDEAADVWWKLVVASSASCDRAGRALSELARGCLLRRRDEPPFFVPSPEDELVAVLLRIAIEHGELSPRRRYQLQELARRVEDPAHLEATLDMLWLPRTDVRALLRRIERDDWDELLAQRREVARRLRRGAPLLARLRGALAGVLRPLDRRLRRSVPGALRVAIAPGEHAAALGAALAGGLYGDAVRIDTAAAPGGVRGLVARLMRGGRDRLRAAWYRRAGRFVILVGYAPWGSEEVAPRSGWRRGLQSLVARALPRPDLVLETGSEPVEGAERAPSPRRARIERSWIDAGLEPSALRREAVARVWRTLQRRRRGPTPP